MTIVTIAPHAAAHKPPKRRVTCITCQLTKCVGRCKFEAVAGPRAPKAA